MSEVKKVLATYNPGSVHWVGDAFFVRNMFPSNGLDKQIDPFLLLDYAAPSEFSPTSQQRKVGEHPHRGFETVTIAYQGSVEHFDSAGNNGIINPGDVQWMTAGQGIVHEERHAPEFTKMGGTFEMVQLWVNLPKKHKMTAPRYQTLENNKIPIVQLGAPNNYARIIAGELHGTRGPAKTFTPINLIDLCLASGSASLTFPTGYSTAIFLLNGNVTINNVVLEGEAKIALLDNTHEAVSLLAHDRTRLLIMNGNQLMNRSLV